MADPPKRTEQSAAEEPSPHNPILAQAIVDLHIARRTLLIYPASHKQVKSAVIKAHKGLVSALHQRQSLDLTVMDDGLGIDGSPLSAKNPVFKELAHDFKRYGIATVRFDSGIAAKDVGRFLQLLTLDRQTVNAKGGIGHVCDAAQLTHIAIQAVDYSQLQLTEEEEIRRANGKTETASIWQQFVSQIVEDGEQAKSGGALSAIDPDALAVLLNSQQLDSDTAVAHYGQLLDASAAGEHGGALPSPQALGQFKRMIRDLHPDIQEQFLAATFERCGHSASDRDTATLVDGLGGDLIVRMLRQASAQGREISPSLMAFIAKMGHAGSPDGPNNDNAPALSNGQVDALLTREEYEEYVDTGYAKLLHSLTHHRQGDDTAPTTFSQFVARDLSDAQVQSHVGRAIARLMEDSADAAIYRNWARQLTYHLDDLVASGAFAYLVELVAFIRNEQRNADTERAAIAGLVMERFTDPQFVASAIDQVQVSDAAVSPEALAFLIELGEPVVVEIFDGLDPNMTLVDEGVVSQILGNLSALTAKEALARIKDPRPGYVRRMVRIIRRLGDSQAAEAIRPLLDHDDASVREEALATLLKFRNKWGLIRMRDILATRWGSEVAQALSLAGRYKVRDVVPQLVDLADGHRDIECRKAALRALGEIGDSRALDTVAKLLRRRWNVFSKQSLELKRVAFETLIGYSPTEVKALLHLGLQQKDEQIKIICKETLRQMSRDARKTATEDSDA